MSFGGKGGGDAPSPVPVGAYLVGSQTPYGTTSYRQTGTVRVRNGPDQPQYTQYVTLSPAQQRLQSTNEAATQRMADLARTNLGNIGGQAVQDALYRRSTAILDPQFAREQSHLEAQLAAQGVNPNSAAYNDALDNFARRRQGAYEAARNDAISGAGAEESRRVAEIQALLGRGVTMPQGDQTGTAAASSAANAATQANAQNYAIQQQQAGATQGGIFGLLGNLGAAGILSYPWAAGAAASDARLKDIIRPAGMLGPFKLWLFTFKGSSQPQLGVIAQEVEQIAPALVHEMPNGFLAVDYGGLIDVALS